MRRCARQLFFSDLAAWHNARDPLRRESFLLTQLKSLETWRGLIVHQIIHTLVVPCWRENLAVPWSRILVEARELAMRQFTFSAEKRYRESGMSKKKAHGDYCALFPHEFGVSVPQHQLSETLGSIQSALENLSRMHDFLGHVERRNYYRSELALSAEYNDVRIKGQIDLLFGRSYGKYSVVDWKAYETPSGSDARLQMSLYAWLLCRNNVRRVSDPRDVELWEVKLREGEAVCHQIDRALFDELEDFIYRSTEQMRALCGDGSYEQQNLDDFPHTENQNSCRFCPFRNPCREPERWITIGSASLKSKTQASLLSFIA